MHISPHMTQGPASNATEGAYTRMKAKTLPKPKAAHFSPSS